MSVDAERSRPPAGRGPHGARGLTRSARGRALDALRARLRAEVECGRALLLILDFDGTLVPLQHRPDAVRLAPTVRRTLRRLVDDPRLRLAVLSGRALSDVRRRIRLRGVLYGGCHGLALSGPGFAFRHPAAPDIRGRLRAAATALMAAMEGMHGVLVEEKGLTLAVHYGGVRSCRRRLLRRLVARVAGRAGLAVLPGKRVWELVPAGYLGKAMGARLIQRHVVRASGAREWLTVYVGDDVTDRHAIRSLAAPSVGVLVGARPGPTVYRLHGVREVHALLRWLDRLFRATRSSGDRGSNAEKVPEPAVAPPVRRIVGLARRDRAR